MILRRAVLLALTVPMVVAYLLVGMGFFNFCVWFSRDDDDDYVRWSDFGSAWLSYWQPIQTQ